MRTNLLVSLLEDVIETNRDGKYLAGFRYSRHDQEIITVDLYNDSISFFQETATNNAELFKMITDFREARRNKIRYSVSYKVDDKTLESIVESEMLATAKAFMLKDKYNIDARITEVVNENL